MRGILVLLCVPCLYAQPQQVTFTAEARFNNGQRSLDIAPGVTLEHLPGSPQSLLVSNQNFNYGGYGQFKLTIATPPLQLPDDFLVPFTITIQRLDTGATGTLRGNVSIQYNLAVSNIPNLVISVGANLLATLSGVHFSVPRETVLWDRTNPARTLYADIPARLTSGSIVITPPILEIPYTPGISTRGTGSYTTVSNAPCKGQLITDGIAANCLNGVISVLIGAVTPGSFTSFQAVFTSAGLPPATLPVRLIVQTPTYLRVTPHEITYNYTQGGPAPPPQTVTVSSDVPLAFTPKLYDGSWLPLTNGDTTSTGSTQFPVPVNLANKPAGYHRTRVILRSEGNNLEGDFYVNFYIAAAPGTLTTTTQPAAGGTIAISPQQPTYPNATALTVTATPAPGFVFARFSGAINTIDNPAPLTVNGPTSVTAEFFPILNNCTYTISSTRVLAPATSETGRWDIATQPNCSWLVSQRPTWISLETSPAGLGPGFVSYRIAANTSTTSRTAFPRIGDAVAHVDQPGTFCNNLTAAVTATLAIVTAPSTACTYFVSSTQPWLQFPTLGGYAQASSTFDLQLQPNPGDTPRTAALYAGGARLPILQPAATPTAPYSDVPAAHPFASYIALLKATGKAVTCGTNLYCPETTVTRAAMAEALIQALRPANRWFETAFNPTPYFTDVPREHPSFASIQQAYELGLDIGCTNTRFCPDDPVTRAQAAAFLIRARTRSGPYPTVPATTAAYFTDVTSSDGLYTFVQKARDWGITSGCTPNRYCPNDPLTRGQLAVFLVRTLLTD